MYLAMRKLLLFVCVSIFIVSQQSCCTKKYCSGFDELNEIQLFNFESSEVDSISIEIYVKGSNYTKRIDSVFTQAKAKDPADKDLFIFMPEKLNRNHEYKISFLSNSIVYFLSDFEVREEECNCPSDKYNVLASYVLNGRKYNSSSIIISK